MDQLPPDWKVIRIADILNEAQVDEVVKILNTTHKDQDQLIRHLKKYFGSIKDHLEEKGVDPCYLAYYLAYIDSRKRRDLFKNN